MKITLLPIVVGVIIGFWALFLLPASIRRVPVGYRGVVTRLGSPTGVIRPEGFFLDFPFISGMKNLDVRTFPTTTAVNAGSIEQQTITAKVSVSWHIDPTKVLEFYRQYGYDDSTQHAMIDQVVTDRVNERVKSSIASLSAADVLKKGDVIKAEISPALKEQLSTYYLVVDSVVISDLDYLDSYNASIEEKQIAEQAALASKNRLEQTKYEAQQVIEQAKGKAEALRIEGEAIAKNPGVAEVRAIEKWNGVLPTVTSGVMPFINIK